MCDTGLVELPCRIHPLANITLSIDDALLEAASVRAAGKSSGDARATQIRISDNAGMKRPDISSRVIRAGDAPPGPPEWEGSTPESRMSAVWELTLQCLAWRGAGEPRLQRSVVRIQRAPR